jgi:hypothetical protein
VEKVLFIAFHFPPRGGPGVHRSLNFVNHLRSCGYEPVVLTVTEEDLRKGNYEWDESLKTRIPKDMEVHRCSSGENFFLRRVLMKLRLFRLFWFFLYPFFWERTAGWPRAAMPRALELIQQHNISLVYTSSAPFASAWLGYRLKKKTGIRWVADLRDPFTDGYQWDFPSRMHWLFMRRMEKRTLNMADHLVVNTPEVRKLMLEKGILNAEKISAITNAY